MLIGSGFASDLETGQKFRPPTRRSVWANEFQGFPVPHLWHRHCPPNCKVIPAEVAEMHQVRVHRGGAEFSSNSWVASHLTFGWSNSRFTCSGPYLKHSNLNRSVERKTNLIIPIGEIRYLRKWSRHHFFVFHLTEKDVLLSPTSFSIKTL